MEFCKTFENYAYLWLEERDAVMEIFLTYGRILLPEEIDRIGTEDPENPAPVPCTPKMEAFREQIDQFENLFLDIEEMESYKIFNSWFQACFTKFLSIRYLLALRFSTLCLF